MNKQTVLDYINKKYQQKEPVKFNIGDTIRAAVKISEGGTSRIQAFEGVVIGFGGQGTSRTFTVRKISFGVGVERCFPLYSPNLDKIEVVRSGHNRRAKLYYLRNRVGRSAKLEEKETLTTVASELKKTIDQKPAGPSNEAELVGGAKK